MLCPISMHHEATLHHDVHVCYSALGLLACTKKNLCWLDYSAAALGLFACTKKKIVLGWTLGLLCCLLWDCLLAQKKKLCWVGT